MIIYMHCKTNISTFILEFKSKINVKKKLGQSAHNIA